MNHPRHGASANRDGDSASAVSRECAAIAADLERLKTLIADAGDKLLVSFNVVSARVPQMQLSDGERARINAAVTTAVTALQFQDMATQLIAHAQRRLAVLQDCVHTLTHTEHDALLADTRMQPVRQNAVGAGSIDLF